MYIQNVLIYYNCLMIHEIYYYVQKLKRPNNNFFKYVFKMTIGQYNHKKAISHILLYLRKQV